MEKYRSRLREITQIAPAIFLSTLLAIGAGSNSALSAEPEHLKIVERVWNGITAYKAYQNVTPLNPGLPISFKPGLPISFKEELQVHLREMIVDAATDYRSSHVAYGGSFNDFEVELTSGIASLRGPGFDGLFIEFSAPNMCGSSGCTTHIFYRNEAGKWNKLGELFGCTTIKVLEAKTNGFHDIEYGGCRFATQTYTYRYYDGNGYVTD